MFTVVDAPAEYADGKGFIEEIEQLVRIVWICKKVYHYSNVS